MREFVRIVVAFVVGLVIVGMLAVMACFRSLAPSTRVLPEQEARDRFIELADRLEWGPMIGEGQLVHCAEVRAMGVTHWRIAVMDAQRPTTGPSGLLLHWQSVSAATVSAYGWPFRCFIAQDLASALPILNRQPIEFRAFLQQLARESQPIWLALGANVLFVATMWRLAPLAAKRFISLHRRRHNRCPACGYARSESARCPECGALHTR